VLVLGVISELVEVVADGWLLFLLLCFYFG